MKQNQGFNLWCLLSPSFPISLSPISRKKSMNGGGGNMSENLQESVD